jgi:hypothetical protein
MMTLFLLIAACFAVQITLACLVAHRLRSRTVRPDEVDEAVRLYAAAGVRVTWKEPEIEVVDAEERWENEAPSMETAFAGPMASDGVGAR